MAMAPTLGLPKEVRACLFDLDGVLTETAKIHAVAWKEMFDALLKTRAKKTGEPFVAFDKKASDGETHPCRARGRRHDRGCVRLLLSGAARSPSVRRPGGSKFLRHRHRAALNNHSSEAAHPPRRTLTWPTSRRGARRAVMMRHAAPTRPFEIQPLRWRPIAPLRFPRISISKISGGAASPLRILNQPG